MKWCIETFCGHVLEVSSLCDERGESTDELWKAKMCVVHLPDGQWYSSMIEDRMVHRLQ